MCTSDEVDKRMEAHSRLWEPKAALLTKQAFPRNGDEHSCWYRSGERATSTKLLSGEMQLHDNAVLLGLNLCKLAEVTTCQRNEI